jgi:hypothetical protein
MFPLPINLYGDRGFDIAKHTKVGMIWVAGRSPTLVSQNLKATTLTYLAIVRNDCLYQTR